MGWVVLISTVPLYKFFLVSSPSWYNISLVVWGNNTVWNDWSDFTLTQS